MFVKGCDSAVRAFDKKFGMKDALDTKEDTVFAPKTNSDAVKYLYISPETSGKDERCLPGGLDSLVGILNLRAGDEQHRSLFPCPRLRLTWKSLPSGE